MILFCMISPRDRFTFRATKRVRLLEVTVASVEAKSTFERRLEAARLLSTPPGHKLSTYGLLSRMLECVEKSTEQGCPTVVPRGTSSLVRLTFDLCR